MCLAPFSQYNVFKNHHYFKNYVAYINSSFFYNFFFPPTLFLFIYLFYFWLCWVFGSCEGFLQLRQAGATLHCGAWASHYRGLSLQSTGSRRAGSVVVAHRPSCSMACEIFPDQGSNLCPLHWQADSQPLRHQGSPGIWFLFICSFNKHLEALTIRLILF